ncbi:MAG TPA: Rieske 2Fe-2S domain-containing protein [Nocardioidaceae bacterium]|nr:Rieske 2Fe-2S domain-containing protein [Nocardioidaceae bacterium]
MADELPVCAVSALTPGTVMGVGHYAVGNASGSLFAMSRRCRHLGADLAGGSIDKQGCLGSRPMSARRADPTGSCSWCGSTEAFWAPQPWPSVQVSSRSVIAVDCRG